MILSEEEIEQRQKEIEAYFKNNIKQLEKKRAIREGKVAPAKTIKRDGKEVPNPYYVEWKRRKDKSSESVSNGNYIYNSGTGGYNNVQIDYSSTEVRSWIPF